MPLMRGGGIESKVHAMSAAGSVNNQCDENHVADQRSQDEQGKSEIMKQVCKSATSRGRPFGGGRRGRGSGNGGRGSASYLFGNRVKRGNNNNDGEGGEKCDGGGGVASDGNSNNDIVPIFTRRPGRPRGSRGSRAAASTVGTRRIGGVPVPVESGRFKGIKIDRIFCSLKYVLK